MQKVNLPRNVAHPLWPVKFPGSDIGSFAPASMIHHKVSLSRSNKMIVSYSNERGKSYGVSSNQRVLSPQLLLKKEDYVRDCLRVVFGLTPAQREVTLRLLRYAAYYGWVYPKESTITEDPGCSKATFWRTIKLIKELGLITVVNRYVLRPHAQISNLYKLKKLIILIARYLAEHIAHVWPKSLDPWLSLPWPKLFDALVCERDACG